MTNFRIAMTTSAFVFGHWHLVIGIFLCDLCGESEKARLLTSSVQKTERTTPPSTRAAVPVTADASSEARKTHILAISSTVSKRLIRDVGRVLAKNSRSTCSGVLLPLLARSLTNCSTPSEAVGPGR